MICDRTAKCYTQDVPIVEGVGMDFTESQQLHWENEDGERCVTDTQQVTYNINDYIRVKITSCGLEHWMRKRREFGGVPFHLQYCDEETIERYFIEEFAIEFNCHYVGDDWCEFQMWALMGLFSSLLREGMGVGPTPFETSVTLVHRDMKIITPVTTE